MASVIRHTGLAPRPCELPFPSKSLEKKSCDFSVVRKQPGAISFVLTSDGPLTGQ